MVIKILIHISLFILGFIIGNIIYYKFIKSDGNLIIDTSDPTKDKFLLEISSPIDDIYKKKYIKIKITLNRKEDFIDGAR